MGNYTKDLTSLLATDTFTKLLNSSTVHITQLNAAIALLIKANVDFELTFVSGTRRISPEAVLKVYINPSTNVNFKITF